MKSMMKKTTLREIKQSFGRYFAILAIAALGVGLFAGLKVTKDMMHASVDKYLVEQQLYDFRLLSAYGFEQTDVDIIASKEGVRAVGGAYFADVICSDYTGNEMVLKAHSLTESVNGVVLVEGKMPQAANECVVDANLYGSDIIGTTIKLSAGNKEADLENFAYDEYLVTGTVNASYYIQFERGNSSLGNGKVTGFFYIMPEGFTMECFTEIYVKFDADYKAFSKEYEIFIDGLEAEWELYCEEAGVRRYQDIKAEAEKELADAEAEFETERADAEAELSDAKSKLIDAEAEIADGEAEILDGEKDIAEAEKTLKEKEQEIKDAKQEIADNEVLLAENKQELETAWADYYSGKSQINSTRNELNTAMTQITSGEAQFAEAQRQLDDMAAAGLMTPEQLAAAQAMLDAEIAAAGLSVKKAQVQAGLAQINAAEAKLNAGYQELVDAEKLIADAETEIAEAKAQIADGEAEIAKAKTEIADAKEELADAKTELADAKTEVRDSWVDYQKGYKQFEEEIAEAEEEIADARDDIAAIEKPDTYVLGRNTNVGYACFENDAEIVDGIANVFPVFFLLVAALVCMTTMNRMVEEQRTQIGVMKALGYGEMRIMSKYLFYSGSAAVIGSVTGFLAGSKFFPFVIYIAYDIMYNLGDMVYVYDYIIGTISIAVAILCSMGTTWLSCRNELKECAAGLMRPKSPKAGKRVFLEYVPFIWNRLQFLHKVSVRNIVRYKKRFFMMITGISGCTALVVTGFGLRDSIVSIPKLQYEDVQTYQVGISLQESVTETDEEDMDDLINTIKLYNGEYQVGLEQNVDFVCKDEMKAANLVVFAEPEYAGDYFVLTSIEKESLKYPGPGEIILSEKLSEVYDVSVGESVTLRDENRKEMQFTVSGVCENYIGNYVFVHPQSYMAQMDGITYKSLFVKFPAGTDLHKLSAELMQNDSVSTVTLNEDIKLRISSMLESMDFLVVVIIFCAAALAFIVLYNLNNINITERVREIATIKVLGFTKKETASYVFRENMVLTGIGAMIGLLLGKWLHAFVMAQIRIDLVTFDVHVEPVSYLYSVLLTFLFAWLVNRIMSGKLEKISMTESLKSVD